MTYDSRRTEYAAFVSNSFTYLRIIICKAVNDHQDQQTPKD